MGAAKKNGRKQARKTEIESVSERERERESEEKGQNFAQKTKIGFF